MGHILLQIKVVPDVTLLVVTKAQISRLSWPVAQSHKG